MDHRLVRLLFLMGAFGQFLYLEDPWKGRLGDWLFIGLVFGPGALLLLSEASLRARVSLAHVIGAGWYLLLTGVAIHRGLQEPAIPDAAAFGLMMVPATAFSATILISSLQERRARTKAAAEPPSLEQNVPTNEPIE